MSGVLEKSTNHKKRRGRPRCRSAPAAIRNDRVGLKRKQWTNEAMQAAMDDVKSGKSSLSFAARMYNVPRSTLHDRVSGKVEHGKNPGPEPYLSAAEEKEFANFLVDVAKAGYGKTRQQVRNIAGE